MANRVLIFLLGVTAIACSQANPQQSTNSANSPAAVSSASNSNSNTTAPASDASPASPASNLPPAELIGTYIISEVHSGGVITMIRPQVATRFTFGPGSDFVRVSKAPGKRDFKDSGQFSIEGDQLVLKIVMSAGKLQVPVVERRHTFALSQDGSEMRLTAKDGKVAVFRK